MSTHAFSPSRCLAFASSCIALLLTGCAFSGSGSAVSAGLGGSGGSGAAALSGVVHGGKQTIYNATVTLYAMNTGTANYGDTATAYASTTTSTAGAFSFTRGADGGTNAGSTYSCPSGASTASPGSAADPEMYLMAVGGDTSGTITSTNTASAYNNAKAKLVLAIGDCKSLGASTVVTLNEMSTVATMAALQQFFNPSTEMFGAPSSNVTGLLNAVNMISNLDLIPNGIAQQSITPPSSVAGVTITGVPEYQKLNTLANILAACVSSNPTVDDTNCGVLATNAVPPAITTSTNFSTVTFPSAATDTLLAADYMFLNPTESQDYGSTGKLHNLFRLPSPSTGPFQPALASTAQPMDWTIGINYTTNGLCTNIPVVLNPTGVSGATTNTFATPMLSEYGMAIDASGNVWMGGQGGGSSTPTGFDVLFEVSSQGAPLKCLTSVAGGVTANTAGRRIAIDSQGNIWWNTNQGIEEYVTDTTNTSVGTFLTWPKPTGIGLTSGLAADQQGNIYATPDATAGYVYKYPNVATATSAFAASQILALGDTQLPSAADAFRDVVLTQGGYIATLGSTGTRNIYLFTPSTNVAAVNGYQDTKLTVTGDSTSYGLAESSDGSFVGGNTISSTVTTAAAVYKFNGITGASISHSSGLTGGINGIRTVALDGADNIWLGASGTPIDSTGTLGAIGEVDKNYNSISPEGVALSSCTTSPNTGCESEGGFEKSFLPGTTAVFALAVDSSGNVWGAPNANTNPTGTAVIGGTYFTIVGQAVPLKTPIVSNLH